MNFSVAAGALDCIVLLPQKWFAKRGRIACACSAGNLNHP